MYFDGSKFQADLSGTNWKSSCELAAAVFNVRLEDLETWNPGTSNLHPSLRRRFSRANRKQGLETLVFQIAHSLLDPVIVENGMKETRLQIKRRSAQIYRSGCVVSLPF